MKRRRKNDSARRWKARYLLGREIPASIWNEHLVHRVPYSEQTHLYGFHRQTVRLMKPLREPRP